MQRTAWAVATVFGVATFVFFAIRATGDPTLAYLPLTYTQAQHDALAKQLGTDQPIMVQYVRYVGRISRLDFGRSRVFNANAVTIIGKRLPATLELAAVAFIFGVLVSVPLGVVAGIRPGSIADYLARLLATMGQALPNFILAILLVALFGVKLRWLPVEGNGDWTHFVLPAVCLAWFSIAAQARVTRSAVMRTMRQDYVRTAHAKGLPERAVIVRHAVRNALIPIATMIGLSWPAFIGGTIIIEVVFAWPGVGRLLLDAASGRDYALVQATAILLSLFYISANLCTDLSYVVIDPRLRSR